MKKNLLLLLLIIIFFHTACKKNGEVITYPSFGQLSISGTTSSPLLIQIDGKIVDTLNLTSGTLSFPVAEGKHKISLLDSLKKSVVDTSLNFKKKETTSLDNFFYTGSGVLFPDPDSTRRPAAGKMLLRFVITDKSLPDQLNLELFTFNYSSGATTPANVKIDGVRKDRFSNYIELDNPGNGDTFYILEGYDINNNKKLSINEGNYGLVASDNNFSPFTSNSVVSMGIGSIPDYDTSHYPLIIFGRYY